ncbi:SEC-C metal-binding domain-containing protein [Neobacillus drentensis]
MRPLPDRKNNVVDFTTKKTNSRNDPCSCGSGKKYKKCCGR